MPVAGPAQVILSQMLRGMPAQGTPLPVAGIAPSRCLKAAGGDSCGTQAVRFGGIQGVPLESASPLLGGRRDRVLRVSPRRRPLASKPGATRRGLVAAAASRPRLLGRLAAQAVPLKPRVERGAGDAQQPGRSGPVPPGAPESLGKEQFFGQVQELAERA